MLGCCPNIGQDHFPPTSFEIHHPQIALPFDATKLEAITNKLNSAGSLSSRCSLDRSKYSFLLWNPLVQYRVNKSPPIFLHPEFVHTICPSQNF
jgi:hypothetical protein